MAASSRTTPAAERALRASDVRAAYAVLDAGALDDLLLFRRLKKWTVPCFAEYWNASEDVARRALRRLHAAGVVSCLQGRIYGDGGESPTSTSSPGSGRASSRVTWVWDRTPTSGRRR